MGTQKPFGDGGKDFVKKGKISPEPTIAMGAKNLVRCRKRSKKECKKYVPSIGPGSLCRYCKVRVCPANPKLKEIMERYKLKRGGAVKPQN